MRVWPTVRHIDTPTGAAQMHTATAPYAYGVNLPGATDVREFHEVIMAAIANGGVFGEDFADVFKLTKTPEGSACEYILTFA